MTRTWLAAGKLGAGFVTLVLLGCGGGAPPMKGTTSADPAKGTPAPAKGSSEPPAKGANDTHSKGVARLPAEGDLNNTTEKKNAVKAPEKTVFGKLEDCLLYTSDAADE